MFKTFKLFKSFKPLGGFRTAKMVQKVALKDQRLSDRRAEQESVGAIPPT
jgi:hypothetical protein